MRRIIVLGNPGTKRNSYLRQAAVEAGLPVFFDTGMCREAQQPNFDFPKGALAAQQSRIKTVNETDGLLFADWKDWRKELIEGEVFLKIEPPLWKSSSLKELKILTGEYEKRLAELSFLEKEQGVTFFNAPGAIALLLDKRTCKQKLMKAGLPVTELLDGDRKVSDRNAKFSAGNLLDFMREKGMYQIFIKPVKGSGAAGVSAFRYQPATGRMALYTCAMIFPGIGLVNTKRLRHFVSREDIFPLLDEILELDCIWERWYAKAEYQGFSYDLRVVMQEGEMDFVLARLSKGPITNLHLNNHPLQIGDLQLPKSSIYAVKTICQKAMACFEGLRCAGIDILLEKGSLNPRIIEMNGQGDLIYQDIYHENLIYRHQAEIMVDWLRHESS
ncbi:STM4014 family protein [Parablautia muri]|uniref:ATP-grasp domain-containing protein n=1 Tax=Parablautia muri TaxID=2320879 RepID=A0A9X5BJ28_9FIRM|nr:STM4014 family protein [Parablautia muri]NBJ93817.1 hypothetical protein [Parablautia muri]